MAAARDANRLTKVIAALVVLVGSYLLTRSIYFPHTSEGQREARVEAAHKHAKTVVMPMLVKDGRFAEVRVSGWWKDEGYFWVRGGVDTEADLQELRRLITSTHPPAPIAWNVDVTERHVTSTNTAIKTP